MRKILAVFVVLLIMAGCGTKAESYRQSAIVSARNGNYVQALAQLKKAIELEPASSGLFFDLGVIYTYNNQPGPALDAFNQGAKLGPNTDFSDDGFTRALLEDMEIPDGVRLITDMVLKKQKIFAPHEVTSKFYTMDDIEYFWQCIQYKKISDNIINGCATEDEKVVALFDWTYRNVGIVKESQTLFALPYDIMLRGYGLCDRSAWVLACLATQAGFKSNIYMLIDRLADPNSDDYSPHTVALVFFQSKWIVFDTFYGFMPMLADGKTPAGLNELIDNPDLVKRIYPPLANNRLMPFECGLVGIPQEAEAGLPRMLAIENAAGGIIAAPPVIYRNIAERLYFTVNSLFGCNFGFDSRLIFPYKDKSREYVIGSWFYPYILKPFYAQGLFTRQEEIENPAVEYYRQARAFFLAGNYLQALDEFNRLLAASPKKEYAIDIEYFKCLCHFSARDYTKSASGLEQFLSEYPQTMWQVGAVYHLGRSYEALGAKDKALATYRLIASEPGVALRMEKLK